MSLAKKVFCYCKNWDAMQRILILGDFEPISFSGKGQLISECLFEKIVWTKIPTKNLIDSAH